MATVEELVIKIQAAKRDPSERFVCFKNSSVAAAIRQTSLVDILAKKESSI